MSYDLKQIKGYDLVVIDGRTFLIDTGSPSFIIEPVTINGVVCYGQKNQRVLQNLSDTFGFNVEIIGYDIISRFRILTVNKFSKFVEFGEPNINLEYSIPMKNYMVDVVFNGVVTKGYMDTGAPNVMAHESLLTNAKYIGEVIEPTMTGPNNYTSYESVLEINNNKLIVNALKLNKLNYGIQLFFSISMFAKTQYVIDLNKDTIYYE